MTKVIDRRKIGNTSKSS